MQWKVEVDEQLGQIGDACDAEADRVSAAIGDLQKKMEELGESTTTRVLEAKDEILQQVPSRHKSAAGSTYMHS